MVNRRRLIIALGSIGFGLFLHYMSRRKKQYSNAPSPLCWPGGKSSMADKLVEIMPNHNTYVEPFAGAAWVFFDKPLADKNVLNDLDPELISFYKKYRKLPYDAVSKCDMWPDEEKFEKLRDKKDKTVCDYLYLNKWSHGCDMESFSPKKRECTKETCGLGYAIKHQKEQKRKLNNTILENEDFREVIEKYDSPNTLFFLDPPYHEVGVTYRYGAGLSPFDIEQALKGIKGKFMITYNDHPDVREAFEDYNISGIKERYEMAQPGHKEIENLLITNFKPTTKEAMKAYTELTV